VIEDSRLSYLSGHQDFVILNGGGAYVYQPFWPFPLFEVLHAVIGSTFDRTDIKLRFEVQLRKSSVPNIVVTVEVNHAALGDVKALETEVWAHQAKGAFPPHASKYSP
jgi:hypothetical protein